ncbi:FHA domain-containing protein FhaB/FipA [Flexivirga sp. B27]
MSELTLTAIRLGLLALLWAFIFSIVSVLRGDLYGTHVVSKSGDRRSAPAAPQRPAKPVRRGPSRLAIIEGPMRGGSVPMTENGVLIGRNPECTLVLSDDFASGRHARIYTDGNSWMIDDLGSTNGTYVGGERIGQGMPLTEGSRVRIGQTVLEVRK